VPALRKSWKLHRNHWWNSWYSCNR